MAAHAPFRPLVAVNLYGSGGWQAAAHSALSDVASAARGAAPAHDRCRGSRRVRSRGGRQREGIPEARERHLFEQAGGADVRVADLAAEGLTPERPSNRCSSSSSAIAGRRSHLPQLLRQDEAGEVVPVRAVHDQHDGPVSLSLRRLYRVWSYNSFAACRWVCDKASSGFSSTSLERAKAFCGFGTALNDCRKFLQRLFQIAPPPLDNDG